MGAYLTFDGLSGSGKGAVIAWLKKHLESQGKEVVVLKSNKLDPLRDIGAKMHSWCKENHVNHRQFLLPLFAAGNHLFQREVSRAMKDCDIVLQDRSWISNLAYVPASTDLLPSQVWDLYVEHLGAVVPDLAVIVDCDSQVAMERVSRRKGHTDIGFGGKMSGDLAHVALIRAEFLSLPGNLGGNLKIEIVKNAGEYTDDERVVLSRIELVGRQILEAASEWGIVW